MIIFARRQSTDADRRRISRAHDQVMRRLEKDTERAMRSFWRVAARDILQRLEGLSSVPNSPDAIWTPEDMRAEFFRRMIPRWNAAIWSGVEFEFDYVRTANPSVVEQSAMWAEWLHRQESPGTVDLDELASTPPPSIHVDPSNRLMNEVRNTLRNRGVGVWSSVSNTTHDTLRRAIQKGLKDGDDLDALTNRVRGTLKGYSEAQAKRVARSETTLAMNAGQHAERTELEIPAKEWVSTLDARNRGANPKSIFDHLRPDGQITAQDQPFQVSGELLKYPGDSSMGASAGNTINCRCASVASWDEPTFRFDGPGTTVTTPKPKTKPKRKPRKKPEPKPKRTPKPKTSPTSTPDPVEAPRPKPRRQPVIRPKFVGETSDEFQEEVLDAMATIPDNVQQHVLDRGGSVDAGAFVTEVKPSLKGVTPRGWSQGSTWDEAEGFANKNLAVVTELKRTSGGKTVVKSKRVPGVLRHEFGHVVDYSGGNILGQQVSQQQAFLDAYRKDVGTILDRVTEREKSKLAYYLQSGSAGPSEAFAESFGVLYGGGAGYWYEESFRKAFPETLRFMRAYLAGL